MYTCKICRVTIIIGLITAVLTISCGRGHSTKSFISELQNVTATVNNDKNSGNSQNEFKPFPAFPVGNYPKSNVRKLSNTLFSVYGVDYIATVGSLNINNDKVPNNYAIISDDKNKVAFAQYNVTNLTASRPVKIDFVMTKYQPSDESEDLPMNYYIGIANYTNSVWEWNGPYNDDDSLNFYITLNSKEKHDRYVDKLGTLHFTVLSTITNAPKLSKLGRVGLGFTTSTTTISPDYYVNNPHYASIKRISAGSKSISSISSVKQVGLNKTTSSSLEQNTDLKTDRAVSAITKAQYVTLEWDHIDAFNPDDKKNEAYIYVVYRQIEGESKPKKIGTILAPLTYYEDPSNNSISDPPIPDPKPGIKMYYYLQAAHANGSTPLSSSRSIVVQILTPTNVIASTGNPDFTTLSWNEVDGAVSYEIWASYTPNDTEIIKIDTITAPPVTGLPVSYDDTTADYGKTRYYRVKALGAEKVQPEGTSGLSAEVSGMIGKPLKPASNVSASDESAEGKIVISWKHPTTGSTPDGYDIYESTSENGTYTKLSSVGYVTNYEYKPGDNEIHWFMLKSKKDKYQDSDYSNKDCGSVESYVILMDSGGSELPGAFDMFGKPDDTDVRVYYSITGGSTKEFSTKFQSNDSNNEPGITADDGGVSRYGLLWFLRDPKNMSIVPPINFSS